MKFVKTKTYDAWSLCYDGSELLTIDFNSRIESNIFNKYLNSQISKEVVMLLADKKVDYAELVQKYGTIYIHENGSWHSERQPVVLDCIYANDFPNSITDYDTVVCENDSEAPKHFVDALLAKGFKVRVINYFDTRNEEQISELFSVAKNITFTTTLITTKWFEMLLNCVQPTHKVFGVCNDVDKIATAKILAKNKGIKVDFIETI